MRTRSAYGSSIAASNLWDLATRFLRQARSIGRFHHQFLQLRCAQVGRQSCVQPDRRALARERNLRPLDVAAARWAAVREPRGCGVSSSEMVR